MEIKVRNLSPKVVKTIDEMAKKKGYRSREEYLRNHFENKYDKLLKISLSIIEKNTEVMAKFLEENLIDI